MSKLYWLKVEKLKKTFLYYLDPIFASSYKALLSRYIIIN